MIRDGRHTMEVLEYLGREIQVAASIQAIQDRAFQIIEKSVDPITERAPEQPSDGLLYGLIQSGKTSIITVSAAMAADNGFSCILILTSDIDLLYEQTLERIKAALRGLSVLGKNDWSDAQRFERHLRNSPFVIVCSKNSKKLNSLLEAFRTARARRLATLIIDDEADQASLNTLTSKGVPQVSKINEAITSFRAFFPVNTYLQVTATPQALFLQRPDHKYRPSFTILSEPGPGYVGGDSFFGDDSRILRDVDIQEVNLLRVGNQPNPRGRIPTGLRQALCSFLVAATARVIQRPSTGYAFLCHVSINKRDHEYIVQLIENFKEDCIGILNNPTGRKYDELKRALMDSYDDLSITEGGLPQFSDIEENLKFYLRGANVKLINASSSEEIRIDSVYNIFVGGNKLGRGVTIKNLLVSYYGRNPQRPNADTVLQHARMYGYRQNDLGLTRLFLPPTLANHFRLIHQMESALRDLVQRFPDGKFEGLYISTPLQATRRSVLDPNSIGIYVAGGSYNPTYPLRTHAIKANTDWLDEQLRDYDGNSSGSEVTIDAVMTFLEKCIPDKEKGVELWDPKTIKAALIEIRRLKGNKAYLVVRRERNMNQPRRETQGILSGGEADLAPLDAPTLFLYRQNSNTRNEAAVWWPQLRFPDGNYVLAFSFNR